MAGAEMRGGAGRRPQGRTANTRTYTYVDGTAVRKITAVPKQNPERTQAPSTSELTKQNRERALSMNLGYVLFLTAAAVVTVFMCVNFLQLQAKGTRLQKQVTALETKLDSAILENDSDYNRILTGIDLEQVKEIAMNELGMVYAKKSQYVSYDAVDGDYVRKYTDIPTE